MKLHHLQESVRVTMHLNEGYTRVILERTIGKGLANGGIEWDIRTDSIPPHRKNIGSRFIVVTASIWSEGQDTIEELRGACSKIEVQEIMEANNSVSR